MSPSAHASPGAGTPATTGSTSPARLVVVPVFSNALHAGSTSVAYSAVSVRNNSLTTTKGVFFSAASASSRSGQCSTGFTPSNASAPSLPSRPASSIACVSSEPGRGNIPTASAPRAFGASPSTNVCSTVPAGNVAAQASTAALSLDGAPSHTSAMRRAPAGIASIASANVAARVLRIAGEDAWSPTTISVAPLCRTALRMRRSSTGASCAGERPKVMMQFAFSRSTCVPPVSPG